MIRGLNHDPFPDPLPELGLRSPELFPVTTNDERRFLPLFSLLFLWSHVPFYLEGCEHTKPLALFPLKAKTKRADHAKTPKGNLESRGSFNFSSHRKKL